MFVNLVLVSTVLAHMVLVNSFVVKPNASDAAKGVSHVSGMDVLGLTVSQDHFSISQYSLLYHRLFCVSYRFDLSFLFGDHSFTLRKIGV